MPVLVNLFGTVERVAWGMDREPQRAARDRRDARLSEAAGAAGRLARGARHAAAAADGDGDAAAHGRRRRPARRSCCAAPRSTSALLPIQTCWPGEPAPLITWPLVVTKGPGAAPRGRLQPRHLPHAGDRPRHDLDALAEAPRRRAAPSALERRAKREPLPAAAVIGADPGHDPRRRDAGSRHAVGIPVRRPAARPAGSSWSTARRCR